MPTRARTANKKKQPAAVETSDSIAAQMESFLNKGGEIDVIQTGVSGQKGLAGPSYYATSNQKAKAKAEAEAEGGTEATTEAVAEPAAESKPESETA